MELTTIFVLALSPTTVCLLVYVEVKSRRNSTSAEQSPAAEEAIERIVYQERYDVR